VLIVFGFFKAFVYHHCVPPHVLLSIHVVPICRWPGAHCVWLLQGLLCQWAARGLPAEQERGTQQGPRQHQLLQQVRLSQ
jgi:hypothetical protein